MSPAAQEVKLCEACSARIGAAIADAPLRLREPRRQPSFVSTLAWLALEAACVLTVLGLVSWALKPAQVAA